MPVESQKAEGLYVQCVTPWGGLVVQGPWYPWGLLLSTLRVSGWRVLVRRAVLVWVGSRELLCFLDGAC